MNIKIELLARCSDLISDLSWARTLVEDGKEVPCHRKLQGLMAKLLSLVEFAKIIPDDIQVNIKMEAPTEDVAKTTD